MVDCQRRGDTLVVVPMRERVAVDAVVTHAPQSKVVLCSACQAYASWVDCGKG